MASLSFKPAELDLELVVGNSFALDININSDLTGVDLECNVTKADGTHLLSATVIRIDDVLGKIRISLTREEVRKLKPSPTSDGSLRWYLDWVKGSGTRTYLCGAFKVIEK